VRRWRNWQTHQLEVLAPKRHRGSSPLFRTKFLSSGPAGLTWKAVFKMNFLLYAIIVLHVVVCLFLIGVVLLQQGRSADLAGAFGGQGSQTAFGPRAAANVLTRLTTWSAIIFMLTSISLTVLYQRSTTGPHSVLENSKPAPASAPAKPGK
jgi:preprotein translocase subunit SecG